MPITFLTPRVTPHRLEALAVSLLAVATLVMPAVGEASKRASTRSAITDFSQSAGANRQDGATNLAKHHLLPCTKEDEDVNFPVFSVGSEFEGLGLKSLLRYCTAPDTSRAADKLPLHANYLSFNYGDCRIGPGEESCPVPLPVMNLPACEGSIPDLPHKDVTVRGAPGALYDGDRRLELYTGTTKVVIFGKSRAQVIRAAKSLRPTLPNPWQNPEQAPAQEEKDPLAPPAAGALDKTLRCDAAPARGPSFVPRLSFAHGRQHPSVILELYSAGVDGALFHLPAKLRVTPRRMTPGRRYGAVTFLTETSALHSDLVLRHLDRKEKVAPPKLVGMREGHVITEVTITSVGAVTLRKAPQGTTFIKIELDGNVRRFITGPGRCKLDKSRDLWFTFEATTTDGTGFRGRRPTGDLCPSRF